MCSTPNSELRNQSGDYGMKVASVPLHVPSKTVGRNQPVGDGEGDIGKERPDREIHL
jgi:hypothetical protein